MSFAAQLSALSDTMPGLTATDGERADWFDGTADLLDHIARTNGHLSTEASDLADLARRRAAVLREGVAS